MIDQHHSISPGSSEEIEEKVVKHKLFYVSEEGETFTPKSAGFWVRFWAYLLDLLVISSLSSIVIYPLFRIFGWDVHGATWYAPIGFLTGFIFYAYFVIMTTISQQTVGKMIFGLRVVSINSDSLSFVTILFREWIGRFFSATIWPLYVIIGFTPTKQGIHDFIADTMVIHEHVFEKKVIRTELPVSKSSELQQPEAF